jgi:uncharacterized membrane protein YvbJ
METCVRCGQRLAPTWKYCIHCGLKIEHAPEPAGRKSASGAAHVARRPSPWLVLIGSVAIIAGVALLVVGILYGTGTLQ